MKPRSGSHHSRMSSYGPVTMWYGDNGSVVEVRTGDAPYIHISEDDGKISTTNYVSNDDALLAKGLLDWWLETFIAPALNVSVSDHASEEIEPPRAQSAVLEMLPVEDSHRERKFRYIFKFPWIGRR